MNRAHDVTDEGLRLREVNVLRGQPAARQGSAQSSCITALHLPPLDVPDSGTDSWVGSWGGGGGRRQAHTGAWEWGWFGEEEVSHALSLSLASSGLSSNGTFSVGPSLTTLLKSTYPSLPAFSSPLLPPNVLCNLLRIWFTLSPQWEWKFREDRNCYALFTAIISSV